MVSAAREGLGPIDVLINNAGLFPRVPFLEMKEHDWDHLLDVNLKGSCFCAQSGREGGGLGRAAGSIIRLARWSRLSLQKQHYMAYQSHQCRSAHPTARLEHPIARAQNPPRGLVTESRSISFPMAATPHVIAASWAPRP